MWFELSEVCVFDSVTIWPGHCCDSVPQNPVCKTQRKGSVMSCELFSCWPEGRLLKIEGLLDFQRPRWSCSDFHSKDSWTFFLAKLRRSLQPDTRDLLCAVSQEHEGEQLGWRATSPSKPHCLGKECKNGRVIARSNNQTGSLRRRSFNSWRKVIWM